MTRIRNIVIALLFSPFLYSQNPHKPDSLKKPQAQDIGPFHLGVRLNFIGKGMSDIQTGIKTTTGKDVVLSAGGGGFYEFDLGYNVNKSCDISFLVATSSSHLNPRLSNVPGSFTRTLFGGYISYIVPVTDRAFFNLSAGILYASNPVLDIDASQLKGGGHNIYSYNSALAPMAQIEYEKFGKKKFVSWSIGLQYYNVAYSVKSVTSNGTSVPVSALPSSFDIIKNMDGSTININIGISFHIKSEQKPPLRK